MRQCNGRLPWWAARVVSDEPSDEGGLDAERLEAIRRAVAEALEDIAPETRVTLREELRNPDNTTLWSRDVRSREELEAWCMFHEVSRRSLRRALLEYDIAVKNITPKRFQIRGSGRGRYVHVIGERRGRRARLARAEAEGKAEGDGDD